MNFIPIFDCTCVNYAGISTAAETILKLLYSIFGLIFFLLVYSYAGDVSYFQLLFFLQMPNAAGVELIGLNHCVERLGKEDTDIYPNCCNSPIGLLVKGPITYS